MYTKSGTYHIIAHVTCHIMCMSSYHAHDATICDNECRHIVITKQTQKKDDWKENPMFPLPAPGVPAT